MRHHTPTTEDIKKGLHITSHSGKMELIPSISTSMRLNERCTKRAAIEGSICSKCYAETLLKLRKNMNPCLERNTRLLTSEVLPLEMLPRVNAQIFRFESFGELNNTIQVQNYFNICKVNPYTTFALWTKNLDLVRDVIDAGIEKPSNLNIIYSSPMINKSIADIVLDVFPWVDKVFTGYDKAFIKANGSEVNGGSRDCFNCRVCYSKNDIKEINEQLK